ncbi:MAG: hypothetical protein WC444_06215 [Candidatus Paceibacterota bacterium]
MQPPVDRFMEVNMHNYRRLSFDDEFLPELALETEPDECFMFFAEKEDEQE